MSTLPTSAHPPWCTRAVCDTTGVHVSRRHSATPIGDSVTAVSVWLTQRQDVPGAAPMLVLSLAGKATDSHSVSLAQGGALSFILQRLVRAGHSATAIR